MSKKIFNSSILALVVIAGIVATYIYGNAAKSPEFSTYTVKKGDVSSRTELDGKIVPMDSADLGFEIGGKITSLNFAVGDTVEQGQVLAQANNLDLIAQYSQASYNVKSAQAILEEDKASLSKEKYKLKSLKKGDTANSYDEKAQKQQVNAQESVIASQEALVAAAQANEQNVKSQLNQTKIVAPFSGVIAKQDVEVGEVAASGSPIITLISPNSFQIEAYASELDVQNLAVGDRASASLDNSDGNSPIDASVAAIDPAETDIKGVPNYKITLNLNSQVSDLKSGVAVNLEIIQKEEKNVLVVPKDSIMENNGRKSVMVVRNGVKEEQEIKTGVYGADGMVEVSAGLEAGDNIISFPNK